MAHQHRNSYLTICSSHGSMWQICFNLSNPPQGFLRPRWNAAGFRKQTNWFQRVLTFLVDAKILKNNIYLSDFYCTDHFDPSYAEISATLRIWGWMARWCGMVRYLWRFTTNLKPSRFLPKVEQSASDEEMKSWLCIREAMVSVFWKWIQCYKWSCYCTLNPRASRGDPEV